MSTQIKSKHNRLIHRPTGRIFQWNEGLAKRSDMEKYVPEAPKKVAAKVVHESLDEELQVSTEPDASDMAAAVFGKKKASKE
jgi:hypothetical protein